MWNVLRLHRQHGLRLNGCAVLDKKVTFLRAGFSRLAQPISPFPDRHRHIAFDKLKILLIIYESEIKQKYMLMVVI